MSRTYDSLDTLIHKIYKFLSYYDKRDIKNIINDERIKLNDALTSISAKVLRSAIQQKIVKNESRQEFISEKIMAYIKENYMNFNSMSCIVDIGGGNGDVLSYIQQRQATLDNEDTETATKFICVESQEDWVETYTHDNENIGYSFWDNKTMSIPDMSCDIVLCMVSLHHMHPTTLINAISEIKRILKPNGLLLIKEHDANNKQTLKYIDWEHHLYHIMDCAYNKQSIQVSTYLQKSVHQFKPKETWHEYFVSMGLTHVETTNRFLDDVYLENESKNPTKLYWDIFNNPLE